MRAATPVRRYAGHRHAGSPLNMALIFVDVLNTHVRFAAAAFFLRLALLYADGYWSVSLRPRLRLCC